MRLPPLKQADLVGEQAELFDALAGKSLGRDVSFALDEHGAVRGPFNPLLQHPPTGRLLQQMAAVLRFGGRLSDAAREAVILAVAAHWRDEHEWWSHEHIARAAGMSDEQIAALHDGTPVTFDDPVTQAACDAARAILERGDLDEPEYTRVQAVLGDEQLVELTVVVGYYWLLSMQLRVFRIPGPKPF